METLSIGESYLRLVITQLELQVGELKRQSKSLEQRLSEFEADELCRANEDLEESERDACRLDSN